MDLITAVDAAIDISPHRFSSAPFQGWRRHLQTPGVLMQAVSRRAVPLEDDPETPFWADFVVGKSFVSEAEFSTRGLSGSSASLKRGRLPRESCRGLAVVQNATIDSKVLRFLKPSLPANETGHNL